MYQMIISAAVLVICAYTDIRSRKIYKCIAVLYLLLALSGHFVSYWREEEFSVLETAAGLIPGGICLIISFLTKQGIGYGDGILLAVCGISIGATECFAMMLTAFFWAGIWGFIIWRFFQADRKKEIPFVPFLLLGFVIQNAGKLMGI